MWKIGRKSKKWSFSDFEKPASTRTGSNTPPPELEVAIFRGAFIPPKRGSTLGPI
jgi:hypothetical protein